MNRSDRFSVNCQLSAGGAYLTRKFDVYDKYLNRAIGSHGNIYIRLGINDKLKVSSRCKMIPEAGTSHFSNGKNKSPNRGLNFASVSLGVNYLITDYDAAFKEPEIPEYSCRFYQSIAIAAGSTVYDNLINKKYLVSSVYYNIERSINLKSRIGLGAALFYDGSINEALAAEEGITGGVFSNLVRFGMHGSYSLRYKELILGIQAGYHIYSRFTDLTRI